jgi:hypothetical protein
MGTEKKRYGFEAAARRTILSPEKDLESLPGFRIRARKYTITAADEINAAQISKRDQIPARLRGIAMRAESEGRTIEALLAEVPPAEVDLLLADMQPGASSIVDIMRAVILHGLGEHNLDDGETRSSEVTPGLVDSIMDFPELAKEVYGFIQEWNSPLPKATSAPSSTSPNGSIEAAASSPEKSTQTEAAPTS